MELALRMLMTHRGVQDRDTLDALGVLGRALTEARRYSEAEAVLADVVNGRERVLGPDDPETLVARGNLLRAVGRGGRPAEALELAERLLADRQRLQGPDHRSTLDSRGHRAQLLSQLGRDTEAIEELEQVLEARIRVLGASHHDVASTRHNLAAIRSRSRHVDAEDALWELEQNAVALEVELGGDHPDALTAWGLAAEHMQRCGNDARALELLDRIVDARRRVLGVSAAPTLTSGRMRCQSLRDLGRVQEAADSAAVLVSDAASAFGVGSLETLQCQLELVESLRAVVDADSGGPGASAELDAAVARMLSADLGNLDANHPVRLQVEELRAAVEGD